MINIHYSNSKRYLMMNRIRKSTTSIITNGDLIEETIDDDGSIVQVVPLDALDTSPVQDFVVLSWENSGSSRPLREIAAWA